ncbi:MAG: hypothetical protein IV086_04205 [Hyphomonadaceae bacterium]|nr:hypothetical protein [Hyphomonadaceae bacterium]
MAARLARPRASDDSPQRHSAGWPSASAAGSLASMSSDHLPRPYEWSVRRRVIVLALAVLAAAVLTAAALIAAAG